ncbi:MFS transporter [Pseudonocardia acaciae]|uniref:MFS transporter n=1 Tax=Pseudonocardia acaciae TaxID=551276 RepID=UPI00048F684A|nr:MFS transporter [Pseudonocardia acaciae]
MTTTAPPARQGFKTVLASWIGTTIEYYDFAIYGLAASVIFAKVFFPTTDPLVGTLISLSSFGVGYVARPLGGLVFGHLGDRVGRKAILVTTLTMMGSATFLIGLIPSYQQIGILAPIVLVVSRIVQGVSLGGEYSGATLMTVEHAGERRRGLHGGLMNTGTGSGMILANLAFLGVFGLPDDQLLSWGWRIPFLLSAVLVIIGLVVRLKIAESPDFAEVKRRGEIRKLPILDVLRHSGRSVVLVTMGTVGAGVAFTMTTVFSLTYGKVALGMTSGAMLAVLLPAALVTVICVPLFGALADRTGMRPVFVWGAASLLVSPFVWFALLNTRQYGLMLLGFVLLFVGYSANYAMFPGFFSLAFPAAVRFSGLSVGFTLGTIFGNAFAPAIGSGLLASGGGWVALALYMAGTGAISLVAGLLLREPAREDTPPTPATTIDSTPATR